MALVEGRWLKDAVVGVRVIAEWPCLAHLALKQGVRVTYGRIAVEVTFVPRGKSGTLSADTQPP